MAIILNRATSFMVKPNVGGSPAKDRSRMEMKRIAYRGRVEQVGES